MNDFKQFETDIKKEAIRMNDLKHYSVIISWRNKKNEEIARWNAEGKRKGVVKRDILGVFMKQKQLVAEITESIIFSVKRYLATGNKENFEKNLEDKVCRIASDNVKTMLGQSSGDRYFKSNSSATIKRKGRNTPMVDSEDTKDTVESWILKQ